MSWLETANGDRRFASVRGACAECERLQLAWDASLFSTSRRDRRIARGELIDHMRDVVHLDAPPAREPGVDLAWWPDQADGRIPLLSWALRRIA